MVSIMWKNYFESLGGKLNEAGHWDIADYPAQYHAVLSSVSIISPLTQYRLIRFSGEDAQIFLQGQLSSDIREVTDSQSQYSCYSTAKGRVLASFLIWRCQHDYFLLVAADIAEVICQRLSRFILRAKVSAIVLGDEYTLVGLKGEIIRHWGHYLATEIPFKPHQVVASSAGVLWVQVPSGAVIAVIKNELLQNELPVNGAAIVGVEAWSILDIQAGIPWITQATQEQFVAQMANMDLIGAVNFKKGCYPGQEIVARMQYLGKLKRRLYRVKIPTITKPGEILLTPPMSQQPIGMVVNVARVGERISEGLVVVQRAAWDTGVFLESDNSLPLSLLTLPYPLNEE